ncbi:MAG: hypothetical protein HY696_12465 [Deltaproteobacteria bacterium]|nr:hypothetical protein [Deltaproteobacteria bacterium]
MKSNRIYAWLTIMLLVSMSSACSSTGPSAGESGSNGTSSGETPPTGTSGEATETATEENTTTPAVGGSTSAGNPITFDIGGAKALVITDEAATTTTTNLKKLVGDELLDVVSVTNATASTTKSLRANTKATEDGQDLPKIAHIATGPNGEIVLGLSGEITVNEQPCRMIRLSGANAETADVQCVGIAGEDARQLWVAKTWVGDKWEPVPAMRDRVQFDAAGNLYYIATYQGTQETIDGQPSTTEAITKWQHSDGTFTQYVQSGADGDRYLLNFQVLSDGLVFYSAMRPTNYEIFRYITNGQIVTAEIAGTNFFVDESTQQLIASSLWPAGLYALPYTESGFGPPQMIAGKGKGIGTPGEILLDGSELGYFERLTDGTIIGLPVVAMCWTLDESCSTYSVLAKVFPDEPSLIQSPLQGITAFKAIDDDLYLSGTATDDAHDFIRMSVDDPANALHFFPDEDIQLLHFVKIDDVIYFAARRFPGKTHFFGKIDLSKGTTYQELSALQAEILDLKTLF